MGKNKALAHNTSTYFFVFCFFSHFYFTASGQAVVTGVVPSSPRFLPSIFIAHRVQQSHCSSIFQWVLLTHALALSASQFVHNKKSLRIYTSMHSAGLELTKLTYTRLEDNLIRHRGDRHHVYAAPDNVNDWDMSHAGSFLRLVSTIEFISSMFQARFRYWSSWSCTIYRTHLFVIFDVSLVCHSHLTILIRTFFFFLNPPANGEK